MKRHQPDSDISWTRDAIIYQIFPDRFARDSQQSKPGPGFVSWGSKPTAHGFMGGTLRGITEHLEYFLDLGVNLIYLAPIFLPRPIIVTTPTITIRLILVLGPWLTFRRCYPGLTRMAFAYCWMGYSIIAGGDFFPFMMSWNVVRHPPSPPGFSLHDFRLMRSGTLATGVGRNGLSCPFST